MLFLIVAIITIPAIVGFFLVRGKLTSINRRHRQLEYEIRSRLQSIASEVEGELIAGPELRTRRGRLVLLASKAPEIMTIDVAKFTAPLDSPGQLTVVPIQDAKKVIHTRALRPLAMNDPAIDSVYAILASDEALARRLVTPALIEKLQALDRSAKLRSRLQISPSGATLLAARGLAEAHELKAFHEVCADVVDVLRAQLGAKATG